jgi:regulator of RNase E activity RraA
MTKKKTLSAELIETLRSVDAPTVSNAIEAFNVRDIITGFTGHRIRCMFPELGVTVGYAVTAKVDPTSPGPPDVGRGLREFVEMVEASPKPAMLVYQDVGPRPGGAASFGEYVATLMKRLGVVGLVYDGAVNEVRALGFQYFALGSTASHGNPRRVTWGTPVVVDGMYVEPGDLIHGDVNGVITVPLDIAHKLPAEVEKIRALEREAIDFIKSPDFTMDAGLKRMGH